MANGDDSIDIENQLRRRQVLAQMAATTGGSPTSDVMANLRQFDDTGGGTQTTGTGVQQQRGGGLILSALTGLPPRGGSSRGSATADMIPGVSSMSTAKNRLASGLGGLVTGKGFSGFGLGSGVPASGSVYQEPTNRPTLQVNTPPGQPTLQTGQMITTDPNTGQPIAVPHNPFNAPMQPVNPDINNQFMKLFGTYNPNL